MKRASNILLRVGMILGFVCGGLLLLSSLVFIIYGVSPVIREMLIELYNSGDVNTDLPNAESFATFFQTFFLTIGIIYVGLGVVCISSAIVNSITLREPTKSHYLACIILGAISTEISLVGGILGFVALNRENR